MGLSLAAHLVAGGERPTVAATVTLFVVAVAAFSAGSSLLTRRFPAGSSTRPVLLGVLLILVQPLLHGTFSTGHATHDQSHAVVPIGPTGADESTFEILLIAHILAGLITACLLVHGAWMRSRLLDWISIRPARGLTLLSVSWNRSVLGRGDASWPSALDDLVASCAPRRGPPRRTAFAVC